MKKISIVSILLSLITPLGAAAEPVEELIERGDAHAARFEEEDAIKAYSAALEADPENVYLHVAISRQYRHLMSDAGSKREKLQLGNSALEYANRAASLGPRDSHAQLAPGITYGKLLPILSGSKDKLLASKVIKASADRALALEKNNGTASHVLGRWHRGIAEIGGLKRALGGVVYGSLPKSTYANSAACFEKAAELEPRRAMHHIELGCVYAEMKMETGAKAAIERGLSLANTDKDDATIKARGQEVLRKLR